MNFSSTGASGFQLRHTVLLFHARLFHGQVWADKAEGQVEYSPFLPLELSARHMTMSSGYQNLGHNTIQLEICNATNSTLRTTYVRACMSFSQSCHVTCQQRQTNFDPAAQSQTDQLMYCRSGMHVIYYLGTKCGLRYCHSHGH